MTTHMGRLSPCCNLVTVPCGKTLLNPFTNVTSKFENTLLRFKPQMQYCLFANARHVHELPACSAQSHGVPVEIYHSLIASVRQNLPAMHRYVKLRKLLGVDVSSTLYDFYTPIVAY